MYNQHIIGANPSTTLGVQGNGKARRVRFEGPRGVRFLGGMFSPHQLGGMRECCMLPQWGQERSSGDLAT